MSNHNRNIGQEIFRSIHDALSQHLFHHENAIVFLMSAELEFYINSQTIVDLDDPEIQNSFAQVQKKAHDHNINLEYLEQEDGPNQFEVQIQPHDQLTELCDKILITKALLTEHLNATFDPKPSPSLPGNSLHFHVSLYNSVGNNLFAKPHHNAKHYQDNLYQSIGGLLQYMPSSMIIFAPTESCYQRYKNPVQLQIHKHYPTNYSWGINNRTCAIRIPKSHIAAPGDTRIEHRVPSSMADPYLTMALIIWSMGQGIIQKTSCQDPIFGDAYDLQYRHLARLPWEKAEAQRKFDGSDIAHIIKQYQQSSGIDR